MWLIVLLLAFLPILTFLKSWKRRYDIASKIPGPAAWPIIGYTKFFGASQQELFSVVMDLQRQYEGMYKTWLFTELWVIVNDPDIIEKILNDSRLVKSNDYQLLEPWLGTGLLTSEGKKWFGRRKAITPAFHFKILEDFVKVFEKHTNILVEKFRTDDAIDVTKYLPLFTLDNICETAMGIEINAQDNEDSAYVKAVQTVAEITYKRMFNPFLWVNFIFNLTKTSKIYAENLNVIHRQTQKVIETRRQCLIETMKNQKPEQVNEQDAEFGPRKNKMSLLDILLQSTIGGEPLSDSDIAEEVNTFLFAGQDTTSTACGFLLYNVAKHPVIQEKLVQEICDIVGKDKTCEVSMKTLNGLRYLDLVVKESLRYHTTVPIIGRQIWKETEIGEHLFPENTNMSINVYGMCHSEKLFPNPEKFWPERFEADDDKDLAKNPYAFIPFSAGPRNCIGQKFALLEVKMVAVKILQNFVVELANPDEELVFALGMTLKVCNGIYLRFKERKL